MEILLNKKNSKNSQNVNNIITTHLKGGNKLLPSASLFSTINEIELYNQERNACNIIRLNCTINPICSNVFFNNITEIIKNEGAPNAVKSLNYGMIDGYVEREDFEDKIFCKHSEVFMYNGAKTAIKDTQISTEKCGYKYMCGTDIFNNHILRNNTFKTVCFNEMKTLEFNTINDWMRDESGLNIKGVGYRGKILSKQHLYLSQDIETFENTVDNKLIEKNGWFGFTNIGKFAVVDNNNETMDIFRVINYRRSCDFIQMYPSSDLWSFVPKYNPYLHRLENNWNYCLTYPSSSTTHNITFIRESTNSLKIMYVDDRAKLKNGLAAIKIYSISRHGLKKGDFINLYGGDDIILKNCEVRYVENEYIFYIFRNGVEISKIWYDITKEDTDTIGQDDFFLERTMIYQPQSFNDNINSIINELNGTDVYGDISQLDLSDDTYIGNIEYHGITYHLFKGVERFVPYLDSPMPTQNRTILNELKDTLSYQIHVYPESEFNVSGNTVSMFMRYLLTSDRDKVYCGHGDDRMTYYLINNKSVNLDDNAQDLSFKQVVDNEELNYYVRIFSRLPNWKSVDGLIDQHQLYGTDKNLIERYQTLPNDFESHISQLSFAKNIYGDDIAEIVFTDDIDISYLQDNLGRPLTSIYLTIIKNNKGYKEWYGKNGKTISIRNLPNQKDEEYQIEYSHCFGMVNCAFRLSKESLPNIYHNNSMQLNNINNSFQYQGLDVEDLQLNKKIYNKIYPEINIDNDDEDTQNRSYRALFKDILNDEIQYGIYKDTNNLDGNTQPYLGDTHFYGDLCSYSPKNLIEKSIQQVEFRFNTAQRELSTLDKSFKYFKTLYYDEILTDDFDEANFQSKEFTINNANQRKEGYCYYPHYEIPIKSFSRNINEQTSINMTISRMEALFDREEREMTYRIKTMNNHNLQNNDTIYLKYNLRNINNQISEVIYYIGIVKNIIDAKHFECEVFDENHKRIESLNVIDILNYKLFKKDSKTPSYATFTKDGSCRFIWRDVIQNGFNNFSTHEIYPFMNGALYINKQINLFVKRQDPFEYTTLQTGEFPNDIYPNISKIMEENNYYIENDIEC